MLFVAIGVSVFLAFILRNQLSPQLLIPLSSVPTVTAFILPLHIWWLVAIPYTLLIAKRFLLP